MSQKGVAYNAIAVYAGKLVGILISTVTLSLTLRYLGTERYGDYSTIVTFSAVLVAITDLGLGLLVAREIAKGNTQAVNPLGSFKLLATILVAVLGSLAIPLLGYNQQIEYGVMAVVAFTIFTAINNFQIGILQGMHSLNRTAISDTVSRIVNLVLVGVVIYLDLGFYPLLLVMNIAGLVTYLVNAYFINQLQLPDRRFSLEGLGEFKKDMVTMAVVAALTYLIFKIDILILANLKPSFDVGIYGAAYRILDVAMAIPAIFMAAYFPVIARLYHEQDSPERSRVLRSSFGVLSVIAGFTATAGIVWAPVLMRILAGNEFTTAATVSLFGYSLTSVVVLQILSLFLFFSFFGSYLSTLMIAGARQGALTWMLALALVVNVVGNILFIPSFSYGASAILTVVTEIVLSLPMLIYLFAQRMILPDGLTWLRVIFVSVASGMLTWWLAEIHQAWLLIFPLLYLLLTFLCGGEPRRLVGQLYQKISLRFTNGA